MNGDEVILPHAPGQLKKAFQDHERSGRLATLVVTENSEVGHKFGGAFANGNNEVQTFSKVPVPGLKGWHYIGIIFLAGRIFSYFKSSVVEENLLYETLSLAQAKGEKVAVFPIQAEWFETGNPVDFIEASHRCVDELLSENPAPWAQELLNFMVTRTRSESLVEADELFLMKKLKRVWEKVDATRSAKDP